MELEISINIKSNTIYTETLVIAKVCSNLKYFINKKNIYTTSLHLVILARTLLLKTY